MALIDSSLRQLGGSVGTISAVVFALFLFYIIFAVSVPYPHGVPLIREPPGAKRFSLRTRLAYYTDYQGLLKEAYNEYYKNGKAVALPGVGVKTDVILPKSSLRWLLSQPDEVVSGAAATVDFTYIYYALGTDAPIMDAWQGMLVKQLNMVLEGISDGLDEELGVAFDRYFGTDTASWKEIDLFPTLRQIIARAASRFTVGLPLCRNQEYLDASFGFVDAAVAHAAACSFVPEPLLPIFGRISGLLQVRRYVRKMQRLLAPLISERLKMLEYEKDNPNHEEPLDHLQMMLRFAQKKRQDELHDLDIMTSRVCVANFGSYHQTAIQTTNLLLNVIGSNEEFNTVAALREEAAHVLSRSEHSPPWVTRNVAKLIKADSVMKETMRLQTMGTRQVVRKVVADGVVTDAGVSLPRGSSVGFLGQPAHLDDETYEDALNFDPFRFSRAREAVEDGQEKTGTSSAFVSTSPDYLPFGTGRHACPGRFLVEFELKMILTYVLTHYDIKFPDSYGGKRPANTRLGEVNFPPAGVKIMVRRRTP